MSAASPKPDPTPGARPSGVSDPADAAQSIQQMFDAIAPRYDLPTTCCRQGSTVSGGIALRAPCAPSWPVPRPSSLTYAAAPAT